MNIGETSWEELSEKPLLGQWCFVQIEYGAITTVTVAQHKDGEFYQNDKQLVTLGLWKPIIFPEV